MEYIFKYTVSFDPHGFMVSKREAQIEIERLEKLVNSQKELICALNRDYLAACKHRGFVETRLNAALNVQNLNSESHDKLVALRAQVLAFFTVSELFAQGIVTIEGAQKVFAELRRLAVE